MRLIRAVLKGLVSEPVALWRAGWARSGSSAAPLRTALAWTAALIAVVADGLSTFMLLHPLSGGQFAEGNPFAAFAMGLVGMNGYIVGGNVLTLFLLGPILTAQPVTALHRILWWGGIATVVGKMGAGAWNLHLYFLAP